jgi:DNA helicase-2/ATP-dependent DNA helicase PcrA
MCRWLRKVAEVTNKLRPAQQEILKYRSGTMGIAAVPGSGKTWTLSRVAVSLIASGVLENRQEVLIVTLVNAAVDNFRNRIGGFLSEQGLLPGLGYRVRTLHSLAHEIVSQSASLVGLATDFSVVDERIAESILKTAFRASYPRHREELLPFLIEDMPEFRRRRVVEDALPDLLEQVMVKAISHLKSRRCSPRDFRSRLTGESPVLARLAADGYERYEQALATRGALDFDDLISLAIRVLDADETLVESLRQKWPFILEDEAQDSSALQEQILRRLAGDKPNWVRVGDPNQAIYETFTTAHPKYLRAFLLEADARHDLPNSGRSGRPIIRLANELIRWASAEHPVEAVRSTLSLPYIEPAPPGDPQPNPADETCRVLFEFSGETPDQELDRLIDSVREWLPAHAEETVAALVPTNARGAAVVKALADARIPCSDALLRITTSTRKAAGALSRVLRHLAHPDALKTMVAVYPVWYYRVLKEAETEEAQERLEIHLTGLRRCERSEELLWPLPGAEGGEMGLGDGVAASAKAYIEGFREQLQRWHGLVLLPIGELLTAIAQDLFDEPEKLAMTQLFGEILHERSQYHLGVERRMATLHELVAELEVIARDQRRLRSIEADSGGFDPEAHKGEVVVATMHGAKGLEWDRVYLLSVSDYDFPSGQPTDQFRAERWFVRDRLSLEAETLAQLDAVIDNTPYAEGEATQESRLDYARERLRLLYVGITRARRELTVTCNVGPRGKNEPAVPFLALRSYVERGDGKG